MTCFRTIATILANLLIATGCATQSGDGERVSRAGEDTFRVAAAWSWSARGSASYQTGMELAVLEINEGGGIGGLPVAVHRMDDEGSVHAGRLLARRIVADRRYAAVVGHLHSDITLAAAPVYESAGILMLTPASTAPELTRLGRQFVFRTVNSDAVTAQQLAGYAGMKGYRRVAVCYVRSEYGSGLANAFERAASDEGIEVLDRKSYDPSSGQPAYYEELFGEWADRRIDAVLLSATVPAAGMVVRALRAAGVDAPLIGGDGLDDQQLLEMAGEAAEGLVAVTVFSSRNPRADVRRFHRLYVERFGKRPDSWAARGYEAIRLLSDAAIYAERTEMDAASALRSGRRWRSLHGGTSFDAHGDPVDRPGVLIRVQDGLFQFEREVSVGGRPGGTDSLLSSKEIVQNAPQDGSEYNDQRPDDLTAGRADASGQLEQRDDVEDDDDAAAATEGPEVSDALEQIRPASGNGNHQRENQPRD